MQPFNLRPDQLTEEMLDYTRKLGQGCQNLMNADKIDTGVTPKVEVYAEDKLKLYRYEAPADVVQSSVPTLIVYALVNRPYMTDLQENRSTVRNLLAAGQDVYLVDWGKPRKEHAHLGMLDYCDDMMGTALDKIRRHSGSQAASGLARASVGSAPRHTCRRTTGVSLCPVPMRVSKV